MNRAFLIILIPAVLVFAAYVGVIIYLGVRLNLLRFGEGGAGLVAFAVVVYFYQRRKTRRSGSRSW